MQTEQMGEVRPVKKMVSRVKMSKRARRELDQTKRTVWSMSPVTRIRESGKAYRRNKAKLIPAEE